ncbi:hypothetical protein MPL3356_270037 [Mesorhizobium plurifarium]|uniref:Uncharacterized protein n=1 Tax=Mesorhizobium plurifarium TaxID=69974 RepID=A0A090FGZ1_MESPL|nr:hypothetical protein MPL3356_270037 [Mesorhizobium plurifarium]
MLNRKRNVMPETIRGGSGVMDRATGGAKRLFDRFALRRLAGLS